MPQGSELLQSGWIGNSAAAVALHPPREYGEANLERAQIFRQLRNPSQLQTECIVAVIRALFSYCEVFQTTESSFSRIWRGEYCCPCCRQLGGRGDHRDGCKAPTAHCAEGKLEIGFNIPASIDEETALENSSSLSGVPTCAGEVSGCSGISCSPSILSGCLEATHRSVGFCIKGGNRVCQLIRLSISCSQLSMRSVCALLIAALIAAEGCLQDSWLHPGMQEWPVGGRLVCANWRVIQMPQLAAQTKLRHLSSRQQLLMPLWRSRVLPTPQGQLL